jgi:hypothetical protein
MALPLATIADVEARGHPVADGDPEARMEHLLRLGSALIRRRFTEIEVRIAQGDPDEETVKDVLVAMVVRASSATPEGIRSESVSDDTYSVTYVATAGTGVDQIGLTALEETLLSPVDAAPSPVARSARLRAMLS